MSNKKPSFSSESGGFSHSILSITIKIKNLSKNDKKLLTNDNKRAILSLLQQGFNKKQMITEEHDMKNMSKLTAVVAKIVEVFHWVGVGVMFATLILSFVSANSLSVGLNRLDEYTLDGENGIHGGVTMAKEMKVYDFELNILDENGDPSIPAMRFVFVAGIIELALWGMVFRNAHLIAKKTMNPEISYFCPDNLRMLREIGIFAIASPIVSLIISIIAKIVLGLGAETAVSVTGLIIGLLVLFLTQFFVRGAELEKQVEGLV